jgi:hypothetical protein
LEKMMISKLLLAATLVAGFAAPAFAAAPAGPPADVCTTPKFMNFMRSHIGSMGSQGGAQKNNRITLERIDGATTVTATADQIVCEVTAEMGPRSATVKGKFSQTRMPNGKFQFKWMPNY